MFSAMVYSRIHRLLYHFIYPRDRNIALAYPPNRPNILWQFKFERAVCLYLPLRCESTSIVRWAVEPLNFGALNMQRLLSVESEAISKVHKVKAAMSICRYPGWRSSENHFQITNPSTESIQKNRILMLRRKDPNLTSLSPRSSVRTHDPTMKAVDGILRLRPLRQSRTFHSNNRGKHRIWHFA